MTLLLFRLTIITKKNNLKILHMRKKKRKRKRKPCEHPLSPISILIQTCTKCIKKRKTKNYPKLLPIALNDV